MTGSRLVLARFQKLGLVKIRFVPPLDSESQQTRVSFASRLRKVVRKIFRIAPIFVFRISPLRIFVNERSLDADTRWLL